MASLKSLPPCPDNLKPMLHFLKTAAEHDTRDPVVAYWLRFHAVQVGIKIDSKSKPGKTFISGVMDQLETTKKSLKSNEAVSNDIVAQAHLENYAIKLFSWADAEDRAAHFDKNVVRSFYTAGLLFDTLAVWGELSDEVKAQQKYAKWKAAYLHNCLKNGETPVPGPAGGATEEDEELKLIIGQNNPPPSNNNNPNSGAFSYIPSTGHDEDVYDPFYVPAPSKPASHQPVAPPRGVPPPSHPAPRQDDFFPASGAGAGGVLSVSGVQLTGTDMANAQKYCKYAASALQFDDLATATELLEKTLRLIKTGRED